MWRNYLAIAIRQLQKNKIYSLINVTGLGVAVGTTLLIFVVVRYELSYDRFHPNRDRVFRVVTDNRKLSSGEVTGYDGSAPLRLANLVRSNFPQIEKVAAVWNIGGAQIHLPEPGKQQVDEKRFKESNGLFFAEPGVYDMLKTRWLAGGPKELTQPNTAVITRSLADKFFGDWKKAIGRTIEVWSFRVPMKIVGVFQDMPENSDLQIRLGGSYQTFVSINTDWFAQASLAEVPWPNYCYVMLPKGSKASDIEKLLPGFVNRHYSLKEFVSGVTPELHLQPLTAIHLDARYGNYKNDALSASELWALALIGGFLLIVACINFVNLATSQSVTRAKEIGVRKALGSTQPQLIRQILYETGAVSTIAVIVGCVIAYATLPLVRELIQKPISLDLVDQPLIIAFLIVTGLVVTLLAGLYPGFVLARFNPSHALKTKLGSKVVGGISIRRALVVFQFVIAQFLIIGTIVLVQQMKYLRKQSLGFEKNAIAFLELPSNEADQQKLDHFKSRILDVTGLNAASFCMDAPASWGSNNAHFFFDEEPEKREFPANLQFADTSFSETFRIPVVAGRMPRASDTLNEVVVNESLVRKLGLTSPQQIIGKTIAFDAERKLPVVGVLKDYNHKPLRQAIEPLVLGTNKHAYNYVAMRFDASKMNNSIAQVQRIFTGTYPTYIYDLWFLDERLRSFYASDAKTSQLFTIAAIIAIFISCMGLYGLISFTTVQRAKEMGIRKVLGASLNAIVMLFSKEFLLLVGIAFVVAAPIGYYFMHEWLAGFHYRITLSPAIFILALVLSILIACAAIGYKALSAARANPVKSLKAE
jgi:putative ABC transport system permease protein